MGMIFMAPAANIYNCYNVSFGALCDCMFLNIPLDQILEMKDFMIEIVMLIGILIKFTPFTCTATDYNDITKTSVKFEQGRYGTGGYYIKIYDENSKVVGRVTIMYDNNAKNQLNDFLANLKLKCSNISFKFNGNLFWPK